jgi:transposase
VLILANAAHVKNVPGRNTDVADALWLADLLARGLIRPGFVPEAAIQEMRSLLRIRKQLEREQASHIQRLQTTLEDANLKLASVLSQVTGVSGRAIVQALIDGETDPDRLLGLIQRGVKAPAENLRAALRGRVALATSLPAAAASAPDRCPGRGDGRDRRGGGARPRPFPDRGTAAADHPRRQ